jgi:hypothetical protein
MRGNDERNKAQKKIGRMRKIRKWRRFKTL